MDTGSDLNVAYLELYPRRWFEIPHTIFVVNNGPARDDMAKLAPTSSEVIARNLIEDSAYAQSSVTD